MNGSMSSSASGEQQGVKKGSDRKTGGALPANKYNECWEAVTVCDIGKEKCSASLRK